MFKNNILYECSVHTPYCQPVGKRNKNPG